MTATLSPVRSSSARPAITFCLDPGQREALETLRRKEGLRSIAEAIRELINRGIATSN